MTGTEGSGKGVDEGIRQVDWIYHRSSRGPGCIERYFNVLNTYNNTQYTNNYVYSCYFVGLGRNVSTAGTSFKEKLQIRTHTLLSQFD